MATESRSALARANDGAVRRSRRLAPVKTSAAVIDYILQELFSARLRSGDRIDLKEISDELGISRLPVREAVVVLERDGILSTKYHRGVFVEPFDSESIMDDFEIIGLLSGVAVRRLADKRDPEVIADLQGLLRTLRAADPQDHEQTIGLVQQILTLEHRAGGSRRLRAEIRSFTGFVPWVFRVTVAGHHEIAVKYHGRVIRAIAAGDGETAARHRLEDFRTAGARLVRELQARGVIDEDTPSVRYSR